MLILVLLFMINTYRKNQFIQTEVNRLSKVNYYCFIRIAEWRRIEINQEKWFRNTDQDIHQQLKICLKTSVLWN